MLPTIGQRTQVDDDSYEYPDETVPIGSDSCAILPIHRGTKTKMSFECVVRGRPRQEPRRVHVGFVLRLVAPYEQARPQLERCFKQNLLGIRLEKQANETYFLQRCRKG